MRLTPAWFDSSSEDSEGDDADDPDSDPGVTIYHTPRSELAGEGAEFDGRAATFVPDSNAALLTELDEMDTPATVDEVADQLIHPAQPPVDTWAAVHQRLYERRLPELDAESEIDFDEQQGLVERSSPQRAETVVAPAGTGIDTSGIRFAFLALLSLSLLAGVAVVAVSFVM